jgi:hypothetical protein
VIAALALFLSLGGVSYGLATGSIDGREIKNNTVRGADIHNATISSRDLGNSALPVRKFGPVTIALGGQATLVQYESFTITGVCQANGPNTRFRAIISATEAGSAFGSTENTSGSLSGATPEPQRILREQGAGPNTTNHTNSAADGYSATAPSGHSLSGNVHAVVNGQSRNCRAYGDYTRIK